MRTTKRNGFFRSKETLSPTGDTPSARGGRNDTRSRDGRQSCHMNSSVLSLFLCVIFFKRREMCCTRRRLQLCLSLFLLESLFLRELKRNLEDKVSLFTSALSLQTTLSLSFSLSFLYSSSFFSLFSLSSFVLKFCHNCFY